MQATPTTVVTLAPTLVFAVCCALVGLAYWRWVDGRAAGRPRWFAARAGGPGLAGFGVVGVAVTFHSLGLRADVAPPGGEPFPFLQQVGLALPWLAIAVVALPLAGLGVLLAVGLDAYAGYTGRS